MAEPPTARRAPLRLLLVEDERELATSMGETLELLAPEATVTVASSLSEAAAALRGGRFDAVLLDLGLPDSQGLDTLRAVRAQVPDAALLVVTGRGEDQLVADTAAEGAQDYLLKGSFSGEVLVRAVRAAVERQRLVLDLRRSREDLEARVRQQAAVAELGAAAVAVRELDSVFTRAVAVVAETLRIDCSALLQSLPGHRELLVRAGVGWCEGIVGTLRVEGGPGSQAGFTLQSGEAVTTPDLLCETRFHVHPVLRDHGITCGASVPIPGEAEPWGVLNVHSRAPRTFTTDDLHFLAAIANVVGSAVSRQRAEAALREEEARFRGVVDSLAEGVVLTDLERITYVNPRISEITGYGAAQLVGLPIEEASRLIDDVADQPQRLARRQAGEADVVEVRTRRADGSAVWLRMFGAPVRDAAGTVVGTVSAFSDVTEQRAAERARAEAEARLRQVMARSPAVLYALTPLPPHEVTWMSENAGRILGFAAEDFRLLPGLWRERVHADDVAGLPGPDDPWIAGDESVTYEYRFRHADGRWVWVADAATMVRAADGTPLEIVAACQDVTVERQLEEQLRQAQKMEAVGKLAGGVAHDFNNLLTAIGGYSELLLLGMAADDPARHEVEEIRRAGDRAAALTRQLLAFSRRQMLQPRVLDLNSVVDNERLLRRLIGERVRLVTELAEGPLQVKADPGQLDQVVLNLVVNARDAMPSGGRLTIATGRLTVDAPETRHSDARAGRAAFLRVADSGSGMEPEVLQRIFEPFFTTKELGKGTGLGLSTVYGIVKQSGGWIEVESELGKGAVFTVFLPEVEEALLPSRVADAATQGGGAEVVLVVEDEPAVRTLVCHALRAKGYVVLEAAGGAAALELAKGYAGDIQLLVTDVVMPDLRGPELRRRLMPARPGLRTLFMSGYSDGAGIPELGSPGVAFLQKPFSPGGLLRTVREMLDAPPPDAAST